jgi:hypothetical protein
MEKRTMADIRREKFNRQGQIARELADLALKEIDDALAESPLAQEWFGPQDGIPITDSDTLASPIGYYEPPKSIYE